VVGRPQAIAAALVVALTVVASTSTTAYGQPRRKPATPTPSPTPAPAPTPGSGSGSGTAGPGAAAPKPAPAGAVEPDDAAPPTAGVKGKPRVFDFTGLDLAGRLRTPQLLYFLDRASEELERASLERRSFIPAMVRSIDESDL
jgi:hypothetical protein